MFISLSAKNKPHLLLRFMHPINTLKDAGFGMLLHFNDNMTAAELATLGQHLMFFFQQFIFLE